ncbi:MAG TPA: alpha/beta hydrolase [Roseomonas sp.]|jgi:pimeloyl-ACP methyl ester carboxylesterase
MRSILVLLLLSSLLATASARAQRPADPGFEAYRAVFSAATLPAAAGASAITGWSLQYRGAVPHAAFAAAVTLEGRVLRWRFVGGRPSPEVAAREVMEACGREDLRGAPIGAGCRLLAVDLAPGGLPPLMAPHGETIGPFRASPMHWRFGPRRAVGVVVWGHGYNGRTHDNRTSAAPGFLSVLNDAGWDILRYDRDPADDELQASLARLVAALPLLRQAGYARVVIGGQSRGGWQALLAAGERPDAVDAVIATAPAAHGEAPSRTGSAIEDFGRILAGLPRGRLRVGVVLFDDDRYDPDVNRRSAAVEATAETRLAPTLLLRPSAPLRGHEGVAEAGFTTRYAGCLLRLIQAPDATVPRGLRRSGCDSE